MLSNRPVYQVYLKDTANLRRIVHNAQNIENVKIVRWENVSKIKMKKL